MGFGLHSPRRTAGCRAHPQALAFRAQPGSFQLEVQVQVQEVQGQVKDAVLAGPGVAAAIRIGAT